MLRRSTRYLRKILFLLIFLSLVIALSFFLLKSEVFLIKNVIVTTDYNVKANPEIIKILEKTQKQNFFLLKPEEIAGKIKTQDLKIEEVKISREFPGKLFVKIQTRLALAAVKTQDGYFFIDKEGLIFEHGKESGAIPTLNLGLQNPKVGSRIDGKEEIVFKILAFLKGKEEIVFITKEADYYFLQLTEGLSVLFPGKDETQEKLDSLQMMLTRFKIEGKRPIKIDLRFAKPVFSF
ncbi:MAG: FtsQ-type POTRA domain-containing protein [Patescibacteria group bacterium]|nr:FtsQ-type POTRA domain-containing protein [Patescibacteria group bacterium]